MSDPLDFIKDDKLAARIRQAGETPGAAAPLSRVRPVKMQRYSWTPSGMVGTADGMYAAIDELPDLLKADPLPPPPAPNCRIGEPRRFAIDPDDYAAAPGRKKGNE